MWRSKQTRRTRCTKCQHLSNKSTIHQIMQTSKQSMSNSKQQCQHRNTQWQRLNTHVNIATADVKVQQTLSISKQHVTSDHTINTTKQTWQNRNNHVKFDANTFVNKNMSVNKKSREQTKRVCEQKDWQWAKTRLWAQENLLKKKVREQKKDVEQNTIKRRTV